MSQLKTEQGQSLRATHQQRLSVRKEDVNNMDRAGRRTLHRTSSKTTHSYTHSRVPTLDLTNREIAANSETMFESINAISEPTSRERARQIISFFQRAPHAGCDALDVSHDDWDMDHTGTVHLDEKGGLDIRETGEGGVLKVVNRRTLRQRRVTISGTISQHIMPRVYESDRVIVRNVGPTCDVVMRTNAGHTPRRGRRRRNERLI